MTISQDLLLLSCAEVASLLTHEGAMRGVRQAFEAHSSRAGRAFPLVREAISGDGAVFGIKSGDIADKRLLGLKVAGFWPANRGLGKDAHQATILLVDPATGRPKCLLDGNKVTTMRTGAAGGIGIEELARPDSTRLCVFGAGVQARVQLDYALRARPLLRDVSYVTADGERNAALERQFSGRCRLVFSADANAAVATADIVITATPSRQPLFDLAALRPGTHINAVGADTKGKRELPPGLLEQAFLVVDDALQARAVGEAQWAPEAVVMEIGDLLRGQAAPRPPSAISVFDMTGLALQDLTVAESLYRAAVDQGRGARLAWPW